MGALDPITGLFYPDTGDVVWPISNWAKSFLDTIRDWQKARMLQNYTWPLDSDRVAQTGMNPGAKGFVVATRTDWEYFASGGWKKIYPNSGLVPIIPASVAGTGVSVSSNGLVSLSGATIASLNGVFTSEFDKYFLSVELSSASAALNVQARLRAAGTDFSSALYGWSAIDLGYATTPTPAYVGGATDTSMTIGRNNGTSPSSVKTDLSAPFLAQAKPFTIHSEDAGRSRVGGGYINSATSFDGLSIIASTGNMTGSIRLYGYNNMA